MPKDDPSVTDVQAVGKLVHHEIVGDRTLNAEQLWQIPRVGAASISPTNNQMVVPVTTWPDATGVKRTQLWLVSTADESARPITGDQYTAGAPAWSPDGEHLVYTRRPRDESDAKPQLWMLSLHGGEPEQLTDLPLGVADVQWLPDGSGLVLVADLLSTHATIEATRTELTRRENDPVKAHVTEQRLFRFWDHWLTNDERPHWFHLDLESRELRDLTPDNDTWLNFMDSTGEFDISPDGTEVVFAGLAVQDGTNEVDSRIFRFRLAGGAIEPLTPDAPASSVHPRYSPDGKSIVYGRTEDRYFYADRARLYRYDLQSDMHSPWCDQWDQSPDQWEFAADGSLVFVAEHAARTNLYRLRPEESTPSLIAEGGTIAAPQIAADGSIYFSLQNLQKPAEIYQLNPSNEDCRQLTHFTKEAMANVAIGEVREIHCQGESGVTVQSYVIYPPGHDASSPAPFVNVIHGGPHGIWGDQFQYRWNAAVFAGAGYVIALPNYQGSTSWGNDFSQRIQGEWGKLPYEDVMAVTDYLIKQGVADSNRMAAIGGSYGGYLVSWIAGHTDRFRCLVNHAGVYNTLTMYASDATWGRGRCFGSEPWNDMNAIDEYNPARFTAKMNTPMLVIHGEKDYRVPVNNGLECYGVLQAKGVPSRLVYFHDENHWVLKPHNSLLWYREVCDWLNRWLEDESA